MATSANAAGACSPAGEPAGGLRRPAGPVLLTISGSIGTTNVAREARFDRDMLEALGSCGFRTSTPWHTGRPYFEGVRAAWLMRAVGAFGSQANTLALGGSEVPIPVDDFERYDVLLALKCDGRYLPVREMGPLFLLYPFDSNPRLQDFRFQQRSVWHLKSMVLA